MNTEYQYLVQNYSNSSIYSGQHQTWSLTSCASGGSSCGARARWCGGGELTFCSQISETVQIQVKYRKLESQENSSMDI